jgi:uncharacterized membrane protein YeaQ/YmgE (transglycosylase-associated protein family)
MRPQVFIIIMFVGVLIGGIATLSDKGRGLVTYLFLGVVGSGLALAAACAPQSTKPIALTSKIARHATLIGGFWLEN